MLEAPIQTRLSEILRIADEAFDDRDKALSWLREPNIQIGDERPIEAIGTVAGFRAVKTILRQIQYGVFG
jgi:putative toxin-antitoxin system antitoxin component (TIGR02293 family)